MRLRSALILALGFLIVADAHSGVRQSEPSDSVSADSEGTYFPLKHGLTWTYGGSPIEVARVLRSVAVSDTSGRIATVWDGFSGSRIVEVRSGSQVWELRDGEQRMLLDLAADEGAKWTIAGLEGGDDLLDGTTIAMAGRAVAVRTPYATLENCLHLAMRPNPNLADAGLTEAWFAPGLGLVKWVETTIAGPQTYELTGLGYEGSGNPDSTVVLPDDPLPGPGPLPVDTLMSFDRMENVVSLDHDGVRFELASDQPTYTQDDLVVMAYRVTVADRDSVRFRFGSTQQIEFLFVDGDGRKSWAWSEGRFFGEALTSILLGRGDSKTLFARMRVSDAALPEGEYQLLAYLPLLTMPAENSPALKTEVQLAVGIVGDPVLGSLSGVVLDARGGGLSGVHVTAARAFGGDGTQKEDTWTKDDGGYRIDGLPIGKYVVTLEAEGYRPQRTEATVGKGENQLALRLHPDQEDGFGNVHETPHGDLIAELATDRETYALGDSILVRYRLTNATADARTFAFSSGQRFDLTLDGPEGRVWTWSATRDFIQVTGEITLGSGEVYELTEMLPVSPGWASAGDSYMMSAYLTVSPVDEAFGGREQTRGYVKFIVIRDPKAEPPMPTDSLASLDTAILADMEGDSIYVRYTVTNRSAEPVKMMYRSGQPYELLLEAEDGPVWQWSEGKGFHDALWEQNLAARDSIVVREVIPAPGELDREGDTVYTLSAYLTVSADDIGSPGEAQTLTRLAFSVRLDELLVQVVPGKEGGDPVAHDASSADFDGDGNLDFPDFLLFAAAYGTVSGAAEFRTAADLNSDGIVGFSDFLIFARLYTQ